MEAGKNMHRTDYPVFQKYCEKAVSRLTEESIQKFREITDDISRINQLYEVGLNIKINRDETNGKDLSAAQEAKTIGNQYFQKKNYTCALQYYNEGIVKCPQNSIEERELLTILISNRSAVFFELRQFKKVFNDIDYLLEIGNYPKHLQYKIWVRKGKCYDALQKEKHAAEAYNQALESLKFSNLDEDTIKSKIKEVETKRKQKIEPEEGWHLTPIPNPEIFNGGEEYTAAHLKITFEQDKHQGRYAKATEDIEVGTIIIEENAHCTVVDSAHSLSNCQYCMAAVDQPIACQNCSLAVYCSSNCERLAYETFHKTECHVQQSLHEAGASVNCALALRIITQRRYSYFKDKRNKLKDYLRDECKKNVIKKKTYRYDDYDNVFFLCRNQELRPKEELIIYTIMATFLLRLLKLGNYFPFKTEDAVLKDEEAYFGSLILRHLQILQFNAHEVSELKNISNVDVKNNCLLPYENATIGAGLYPTLALFNHSCDPCIVRYNVKGQMVVRTIKPIKANEIIYENYGPLYMSMPRLQRQNYLKTRYYFECLCQPCTDLWPMFDEMKENELNIRCASQGCPFVFSVQLTGGPLLMCSICKKVTSILPHLKSLMLLDELLPEAETLFKAGQFDSALKKFSSGLVVLFNYSSPPHPDIVRVQQRVRTCMVQLGNKACDFKILTEM